MLRNFRRPRIQLWGVFFIVAISCQPIRSAFVQQGNPLAQVLRTPALDSIVSQPNVYEVQILYTQINRDDRQQPHFKTWAWNVDSSRYFYPASMVKMPLALLALEKINHLRASGYPRLSKNTPYALDSLRLQQETYRADSTAPGGKPSIAHDIRQIFAVSDNLAYNHLFEFLGKEYINQTLRQKGYQNTGIVHRFNFARRDNRYTSPIVFADRSGTIFKQGELFDDRLWENKQSGQQKGRGYKNAADSLVLQAFDFSHKNWFALADMERMLRAVIFPESTPEPGRFHLSDEDYSFLYRYMGIFPRECDYPRYDTVEHYDGYVKFFLYGDRHPEWQTAAHPGLRVFNKVGEAYGTLTDVAYIVDFQNNVEFVLAATILCNRDGIFNDDRYDYDNIGFPFLANLGRAVYAYELNRPKKVKPDLSKFKKAIGN